MHKAVLGNKIPLYAQISLAVKQRVRSGVYPAGRPLPTVRQFSEEFGVSVMPVHKAMHLLEEDGVVKTHPGKGVIVADDASCNQAGIFFGVIHPYPRSQGFHQLVLEYIDQAFAERFNFSVVRSSNNDPKQERDTAEHLIANGVTGLVVWPCDDDPNGEYFMELSKTIPVVLVDRLLPGTDLPAVIHDYHTVGKDVCGFLFDESKSKRLLVLMDDLRISSYQELIRGIHEGASERSRETDVTTVYWPLTKLLAQTELGDFKEADAYGSRTARLLREGGFDAVFCTQGTFLDFVLVQGGFMDEFPEVRMGLIGGTVGYAGSRKYIARNPMEWLVDSGAMMSAAADGVQRCVLTRTPPKGITHIKPRRWSRQFGKSKQVNGMEVIV